MTTQTYRWRWPALAALLVAEAMNLFDSTVMPVAGPAIRADLEAGESMLQWLTAGYTLPFALLLITGGRLGDIVGRRRVFVVGVLTFVAARRCVRSRRTSLCCWPLGPCRARAPRWSFRRRSG